MIAHIFWDPPREAFFIPLLDYPVYWYGLFFALGFYGSVLIVRGLIRGRAIACDGKTKVNWSAIDHYIEWLALYSFLGLLVGARLGHVLFYELSYYLHHPIEIVKIWQGGLSSHGAIIGVAFALWLFNKKQWKQTYLPKGRDLLDVMAIGSAWIAGCIRIGNFFNQEIVGIQSSLPWAVIFGSPQDAIGVVPRHPAQLYEAIVAFGLLIALLIYGRKGRWASGGIVAGWYLLILFIFRCLIETIKVPQCDFDMGSLHMGQLLSVPVLVLAIVLIIQGHAKKSKERT